MCGLQLVQALRYEPSLQRDEEVSEPSVSSVDDDPTQSRRKYQLSPLADFLISRSLHRWAVHCVEGFSILLMIDTVVPHVSQNSILCSTLRTKR